MLILEPIFARISFQNFDFNLLSFLRTPLRDRRAYELVEERHAELVKAMGGAGFEAKVKAFQAATRSMSGKKFIGGVPKESPFKWVDKKAADAAGIEPVVPGCFTEPTGGGQAVAYIYFDPVTLVNKNTSPSCIKGCNLDAGGA